MARYVFLSVNRQKATTRALFEKLFGEFLDTDGTPSDTPVGQTGPHQVSDSEMEIALNDDAQWEDVLPASDEGPPITPKAPDG